MTGNNITTSGVFHVFFLKKFTYTEMHAAIPKEITVTMSINKEEIFFPNILSA